MSHDLDLAENKGTKKKAFQPALTSTLYLDPARVREDGDKGDAVH